MNGLPSELRGLPAPWSSTHRWRRGDAVDALPPEPAVADTALDVLERCLRALPSLPEGSMESLPDDLQGFWGATQDALAEVVPTLDAFGDAPIAAFLAPREAAAPSASLVEALGVVWLRATVQDLISSVLRWLSTRAREVRAPQVLARLGRTLQLAPQLPAEVAGALMSTYGLVGRKEALPLLESLATEGTGAPELRALAAHHAAWVRHLPD